MVFRLHVNCYLIQQSAQTHLLSILCAPFRMEFRAANILMPNLSLCVRAYVLVFVGRGRIAVMGTRESNGVHGLGRWSWGVSNKRHHWPGENFVSKILIVRNDRVSIASNECGHPFYCCAECAMRQASLQFHTIYKHMYYTRRTVSCEGEAERNAAKRNIQWAHWRLFGQRTRDERMWCKFKRP